jgi:hypothetical protein
MDQRRDQRRDLREIRERSRRRHILIPEVPG